MDLARDSYKPSPLILCAKQVLSILDRWLPPRYFNKFYGIAFSLYRVAIRFFYLRFWLCSIISGNTKELRKVSAVFKVMPYSLVGWRGLEATFEVVLKVQNEGISGSIVECGVAQGGAAALMALLEAEAGNHRRIWLFDSFQGLPEPTGDDFISGATGRHVRPLLKGSCLGTYEQVTDLLFRRFRLNRNNIFMIKGWFQDSLPVYRDRIGSIALLRIDADWYDSVKRCLENLYNQVVPGGYVIVDDYASCFGAQKALDEFLCSRNLQVDLLPDGRGGCHFIKPM